MQSAEAHAEFNTAPSRTGVGDTAAMRLMHNTVTRFKTAPSRTGVGDLSSVSCSHMALCSSKQLQAELALETKPHSSHATPGFAVQNSSKPNWRWRPCCEHPPYRQRGIGSKQLQAELVLVTSTTRRSPCRRSQVQNSSKPNWRWRPGPPHNYLIQRVTSSKQLQTELVLVTPCGTRNRRTSGRKFKTVPSRTGFGDGDLQ